MGESERRRQYRYNRVLIETERVLDPQFDDAVVFLTGAQIELLRNVSQYLNRLDTYVTEYASGYYLAPTSEDYDTILAIVADLEETLMGNQNVIFGYLETLAGDNTGVASGAGDKIIYAAAVPEGQIWRIEGVLARNTETACSSIRIVASLAAKEVLLLDKASPGANESIFFEGIATIDYEAQIYAKFYDCQDGDHLRIEWRGYKMQVP